MIGVEWARSAREVLKSVGLEPLYRESPLAHTIDPRFLPELAPWLAGEPAYLTGGA